MSLSISVCKCIIHNSKIPKTLGKLHAGWPPTRTATTTGTMAVCGFCCRTLAEFTRTEFCFKGQNTKMLSMRESFLFAHKIYETCSEAIERSLIIGCWVHSSSRSTHSISNAVSPPHSTSGWMGNVYFPNGIINKNEERMETNWNENSLNQFEKRHIIMLVKLWGHKTRKRNSQKLTSSGESCSNKINHLST